MVECFWVSLLDIVCSYRVKDSKVMGKPDWNWFEVKRQGPMGNGVARDSLMRYIFYIEILMVELGRT